MNQHKDKAAREPSYILVLDGFRPVTVLDENDSCSPYYPSDRCGGCGECMMMQLAHWSGEQLQQYGDCTFKAKPLTGFWKFYDWAYYNIITRPANIWWHVRLFALGVYTYGPMGYYRHWQKMKDFYEGF